VPDKDKCPQFGAFLPPLFSVAGDESHASNPILADFLLVARKLEQIGFVYCNGRVDIP
jgi:hypothetical protein